MKLIKTEIAGLVVLEPEIFKDDRGFFFESYSKQRYEKFGVPDNFVQDNISKSKLGTVRGLHYQVGEKAQGKLCQVLEGEVLDVAVDIRFNSPTFGKHLAQVLSSQNNLQLWIPAGFAHGFSVLSEEAIFFYKCTNYYSKANERSILFNDSDLKIDWKIKYPIVSEKDLKAARLKDIERDFVYQPE